MSKAFMSTLYEMTGGDINAFQLRHKPFCAHLSDTWLKDTAQNKAVVPYIMSKILKMWGISKDKYSKVMLGIPLMFAMYEQFKGLGPDIDGFTLHAECLFEYGLESDSDSNSESESESESAPAPAPVTPSPRKRGRPKGSKDMSPRTRNSSGKKKSRKKKSRKV